MNLPFTHAQFLDVLGDYNTALWPVAAALWLATLILAVQPSRGRARPEAWWPCSPCTGPGAESHITRSTSPASTRPPSCSPDCSSSRRRHWSGSASCVTASRSTPGARRDTSSPSCSSRTRWPTRGWCSWRACSSRAHPRSASRAPRPCSPRGCSWWRVPAPRGIVIPIAWALVGGTAAFSMSVTPDLMLFVAAAVMLAYAVSPQLLARTGTA